MYRHALFLLLLAGCSGPAAAPPSTAPAPPPAAEPLRTADVLAEADARRLGEPIRISISSSSAEVRRAAAVALARLHDPSAGPLLVGALRDPDPEVRDAASLGLGALEGAAPEDAAPALLGALAAETDPGRRAHILEDAGRLAGDEILAALPAALSSDHAEERRGACRALGSVGLRGRPVPSDVLRRVVDRLVDDASPGVRLACAYALTRLAPPDDPTERDAVGAPLSRAIGDPDSDVRAMAFRALARYPAASIERVAEGTHDPDWPVAVHAFRTLARRAAQEHREADLARELSSSIDRLLASGDVAPGGPLHVALTAMESARPLARDPAVRSASEAALTRLTRVPAGATPSRDRGLAHCGAAQLVDLARGWRPTRVLECGLGQVSETERKVLAAAVVGEAEGSDPERVAYLEQRLVADESPAVRSAALAALGAIEHPAALALVVRAARGEGDIGARITAMEALRAFRARRAERLAAELLAGTPTTDSWPHDDVVAAMRAAAEAVLASDDLEALVTWIGVAAEVAPRELSDQARPLATHPNLAVRTATRELLTEAGAQFPEGAPRPPANPLDAAAIADAPRGRAVVETDRGRFVIELRPDLAPTTVVRFAGLVRAGFFDGLTFHRVVPAFVVQGGDPRGDGYGGPGWSQRCEDHRLPYERGTVGMALAGRDTGGSQFFVTQTPQPHLDTRYTAFAQVVEGMDVVDRLQMGDRIRTVRLEPPAGNQE